MATSLNDLPPELIQLILEHLHPSQPRLASLALSARALTGPAQYVLFANASITSIEQFDLLLAVLQPVRPPRQQATAGELEKADSLGWEDEEDCVDSPWARALGTTRLKVECREFGQAGWGTRLGRLLRLAPNVRTVSLRGIDSLRIKFLQGRGGEPLLATRCPAFQSADPLFLYTGATSLSITSTTFKNHALPSSPSLATFLRSVRHLTLANLGLPYPSTHVQHILSHCCHNLTYLALSALRDLHTPELLLPLFALLGPASAPRLRHIRFGSLDSRQTDIIARESCLGSLTQVTKITWTFPLPTAELLAATPTSVTTLVLKPRAGLGTDKEDRMQAMEEEDAVSAALDKALKDGKLGGGMREIRWEGGKGAGRRLQQAAGDEGVVVCL